MPSQHLQNASIVPESSGAHQTSPAEPLTSREEENCLWSFQDSPLDVSFAPPQTRSKGSRCFHNLRLKKYSCQDLSMRTNTYSHRDASACAHTHAHAHTVILYIHPNRFEQRVLSCDKQTHQGPRERPFKFGQAVYHSSHPSAPLWVWDTDPGSAYCSQKHILKPIHNSGEVTGILDVLVGIWCFGLSCSGRVMPV